MLKLVPFQKHFIHKTSSYNAGHSKWSNIKHLKASKDNEKAAVFTKFSRQLRVAVQQGGTIDPSLNPGLRGVIDKALRKNMPLASIQTAIKKQSKTPLGQYVLHIQALNKLHIVCVVRTDNLTGLRMSLMTIVRKAGGNVGFVVAGNLFDDFGLIEAVAADNKKGSCSLEESCLEDAIACGAEEVEVVDMEMGLVCFVCKPVELRRIGGFLSGKGYVVGSSEHVYVAKKAVVLNDKERKAYDTLVGKLIALKGIQAVYDNLDVVE